MDNLLALVPKNLIAIFAIGAGILLIVFLQPPHTVCDSQLEILKESQKKFLFKDPKSKTQKTTPYQHLMDTCKLTNNPGGCYELFQELKVLTQDLEILSANCARAVGDLSEFRRALWDPAELLVRLAWGEKPPTAYHAKFGWLDTADISLFCKLKARIHATYGQDAWESFRERMMRDLPGAKDLPRNQVWEMSLLSENCQRYP
ncbi:MAG: hypothetical protein AB7G93_17450 [Bdellovibrionales bacterium]